MNKTPHVALLIETSRSYGREILRGIRRYVTEHGPWSIFMELRSLESPPPPWLKHWQGDGILTRTGTPEMARAISQAKVPAIELRTRRFGEHFPFVGIDNQALVQSVVRHFLDRGFRNFAVYALDTEDYFAERCDGFLAEVQKVGFECHLYRQAGSREQPAQWEKQQERLRRWLSKLPKPIGVLACTDQLGFWLLDACKRAELAVPEEVAVVGVENDDSLCTMASPPLTSVPLGGEQIGYRAAEELAALMEGKSSPTEPILLPPPDIVVRQSSDIVAIDDPEIAEAIRYIREHATHGIGVEDILHTVAISRSSLERRMRELLGRSPNAEINRVRLEHVKRFLLETDLSLDRIAEKAGFRHPQYLSELFKRTFGLTPGAWRTKQRETH
ncbi:Xylose operon transcription regulator XylR [Planctomycetales bacterium 10988]|nr:Xylose operon transcription regulator XylR [Planctomycetales bacterium 10988]